MPFGKNLQKIVDKLILCVNICRSEIKNKRIYVCHIVQIVLTKIDTQVSVLILVIV